MKKILMTLSLAFAAAIAIPSAMNAQDINASEKTEINKECKKTDAKDCKCDKDCKDKKDCKRKKGDFKRHGKGGKMAKGAQNPLFDGITLSAEQQEQFKALREKRVAEHKAARAEMKKDNAEKKAANAELRKQKAQAYDQEIEKILTPEQFKKYKENKEVLDKDKRSHCK